MGGNASTSIDRSALGLETSDLVTVEFRWSEGGEVVFVSGSYSNWATKVHLPKRDDGTCKCLLQIKPGLIQYKFIVDGEWRCASDQSQRKDAAGNLNNWIVVEENQKSSELWEKGTKSRSREEGEISPSSLSKEMPQYDLTVEPPPSPRSSYDNYIPPSTDYMKEPPLVPQQLLSCVLNRPLKPSGLSLLPSPAHVMLNHVYHPESKLDGLYSSCVSKRFRNKFVTTVFFSNHPTRASRSASVGGAAGGGLRIATPSSGIGISRVTTPTASGRSLSASSTPTARGSSKSLVGSTSTAATTTTGTRHPKPISRP